MASRSFDAFPRETEMDRAALHATGVMRVAFHFNAEEYGGYYGPPIERLLMKQLRRLDATLLHVWIRRGDLLVSQ